MHRQGRHAGEPRGAHEHPRRGQGSRAMPVGVDAGEGGGHEHPQGKRHQLDAGRDRRIALGALEVEDEQEHQREAGEPVDEGSRRRGCEQAVAEDLQIEHRRP